MLGRLDPFTELGDRNEKKNGLMHAAGKRFPDLSPKLMPHAVREASSRNRELSIKPGAMDYLAKVRCCCRTPLQAQSEI